MINPDASMIEICCSLIIAYLYVSICCLNSFSNLDETAKKNAPFGSYIKTSSGNSILSIILLPSLFLVFALVNFKLELLYILFIKLNDETINPIPIDTVKSKVIVRIIVKNKQKSIVNSLNMLQYSHIYKA